MGSIYVFVYFGGEWDDCNVYSGYSVCGVLVPESCTYSDIINLISTEIGKSPDTHQYTLQYQALMNGPRIRISTDASLSFYLGLKMGESDKRNFPLCIDVSPLPNISDCFDNLRACGQEPVNIMSLVMCLNYCGEPGELINEFMQSNQTIEEMGRELSEYISFPNGNDVDLSNVIITQPSVDDVVVGKIFKDKDLLVTSVSLFAIKNRFQFKVVKSDQVSYSLKCLKKCCNWTFRASKTGKVGNFKIRRMDDCHKCPNDNVLGSHRQASTLVIANCVKFRFQNARRIYTPGDIIKDMKETFGVTVSYDKAWRSRERAIRMIRGDLDESYRTLPSYMYMIEIANPGSYTRIETDDDDRFLFSFVALGASIAGWKHCKPVIVVDGTFLTNRYGGTLFTACTQDANNNIFILAFGVGDAENNNAWEWFFLRLREAFGDRDGLCIVYDRHRSISHAAELVYPNALHGACTYHLLQNLKKEIGKKGKGMRVPFNATARAYTITEFETPT